MTISEVISRNYDSLLSKCTKTDTAIYGGRTSEDLLGDTCLTALNKFKDEDITEEEGFSYLEKTFLESCFFSYKKKGYESEKMIVFVPDYPDV